MARFNVAYITFRSAVQWALANINFTDHQFQIESERRAASVDKCIIDRFPKVHKEGAVK